MTEAGEVLGMKVFTDPRVPSGMAFIIPQGADPEVTMLAFDDVDIFPLVNLWSSEPENVA